MRDLDALLEDVERTTNEWTRESVCAWVRDHWDYERAHIVGAPVPRREDFLVVDNRVSASAPLYICAPGEDLPFDIENISHRYLSLRETNSLRGCPRYMSANILRVNRVGSFEGAPSIVGDGGPYSVALFLDVESLAGVHEHFGEVRGVVKIGSLVRRNVLGLLLIPGVAAIKPSFGGPDDDLLNQDTRTLVSEILDRQLGRGTQGLARAQRELIDAGLDEYAEL